MWVIDFKPILISAWLITNHPFFHLNLYSKISPYGPYYCISYISIWDVSNISNRMERSPPKLSFTPTIHETSATPWAWRLACSHLISSTVEGSDERRRKRSLCQSVAWEEWWKMWLNFLNAPKMQHRRILHTGYPGSNLYNLWYPSQISNSFTQPNSITYPLIHLFKLLALVSMLQPNTLGPGVTRCNNNQACLSRSVKPSLKQPKWLWPVVPKRW